MNWNAIFPEKDILDFKRFRWVYVPLIAGALHLCLSLFGLAITLLQHVVSGLLPPLTGPKTFFQAMRIYFLLLAGLGLLSLFLSFSMMKRWHWFKWLTG